jgi:hypothetical protein
MNYSKTAARRRKGDEQQSKTSMSEKARGRRLALSQHAPSCTWPAAPHARSRAAFGISPAAFSSFSSILYFLLLYLPVQVLLL